MAIISEAEVTIVNKVPNLCTMGKMSREEKENKWN